MTKISKSGYRKLSPADRKKVASMVKRTSRKKPTTRKRRW